MSHPVRAPPPPPPSKAGKPGKVTVYRALYNYTAQRDDELTFEAGDLLYVKEAAPNKSWWTAACGDSVGLIPYNYVSEQAEAMINPLHEAAKRGNLALLKELLAHQVPVNGQDSADNTPLHWAARGGHQPCLQAILATPGVCVTVQNKLGETALHLAACHGHLDAVTSLLARNIDVTLTNIDGQKAVELATASGSHACAALLQPRVVNTADDQYGLDDSDSD